MNKKNRILIVDDNITLRKGLRSLLSSHQGFCIVGEAGNGQEAIECVGELHPDIVLIDISMPRMDGLEATRKIKKKWPKIKILAVTNHNSPEYFTAAIKAGADGYILKDSPSAELIQSIENIFSGKRGLNFKR